MFSGIHPFRDCLRTFSAILPAFSHSRNLMRVLQPNIPIFALLNRPIDVTEINFCSVHNLFCMPSSGATQLCLQHCLSKVGVSKLALVYRSLVFHFSVCYEILGIDRTLGNWDSLAGNGKALKLTMHRIHESSQSCQSWHQE